MGRVAESQWKERTTDGRKTILKAKMDRKEGPEVNYVPEVPRQEANLIFIRPGLTVDVFLG